MKKTTILSMITSMVLFVGCGDSTTESSTPEKGTITGTITFTGENCPTTDLTIGMYTNWYPTGPPAAYIEVVGENISDGTYNYTITDIEFGTYAATFVAWEDVNTVNETSGQNQQYTLGLYGSSYDFTTGMLTTPTSITLSATNYEATNVDITASCSLISN